MCCSCAPSNTTEPSQQRVPYCSSFFTPSEFSLVICSSSSAPSKYAFTRVIRFWVRVPVLSEQMTEALPKVSTAGRRRIIAFLLTIRCTPMDSTMVTMAGRPSGMAETARETAVIKISRAGIPLEMPTTKITAQQAIANAPSILPNWVSFCCRGVWPSSSLSRRFAILPISVSIPVAVTIAVAVP